MNFDNLPKSAELEYSFASESINNYLDDYDGDVQDTGAVDLPASDLIEEPLPESAPDPTISQRSAAVTAEVLTLLVDTLFPMCINILAKQESTTMFKASADERKELKRAFTEYAKVKGTDIPPGWALIICIAMIYGIKVPSAMMMRKEKEKADTQKPIERKEYATNIDTPGDREDS